MPAADRAGAVDRCEPVAGVDRTALYAGRRSVPEVHVPEVHVPEVHVGGGSTVRVWRGLGEVRNVERSVVTVGVFDGVHLGHRHVIGQVVARAREIGALAVVVTFDPHPMSVVRPDRAPDTLATLAHRLDLMADQQVDAVLVLEFTDELAHQSASDFVIEVLVDTLHAVEVLVGADFRFGHRASGDVTTLREMGPAHGFTVTPLTLAGGPSAAGRSSWSSTYVRDRLADGDVGHVADVLGRPHRVEGPVVHGDHRGRQLGYPTANLRLGERTAIPADGVYAGFLVRAAGDRLPAAISIGTNPTFDGTERRVEAYVLDRNDLELYGEHVAIEFTHRLRDTVRFQGIEPLLAQMAHDVDRARELTAGGGSAAPVGQPPPTPA